MPRGSPRQRSAEAVPSSLPPSGPAGGNLGGVFPTPTVVGFTGSGGAFLPTTALFAPSDNTVDIGSSATRVKDVHAVRFIAHADAIDSIKATFTATGILFSATVAAVSFTQTQDPVAAGATWTNRAQQGAAGFVGGDYIVGGGDPGTAGAQNAGNTRVELGAPVGQTTASLSLESVGVRFGRIYAGAGANLRIENIAGGVANSGIVVAAQNGVQVTGTTTVFLESLTNQITFSTGNRVVEWYGAGVLARGDIYHATGATSYTHAAGTTSVTFGQTVHAAGAAGNPWFVRAQQGAAGFVGGTLTIGGGDGGTAGVDLAGPTAVELGTVVGQTTAKLSLRTAGTEFGFLHAGAGAYLRIQNVAGGVSNSGIFLNAANALLLTASTNVNVEATSGSILMIPGNRIVEWYGAGVLARTDTLHATGATTYVHAVGTTSVTWSQTQDTSAAGATWTFQAQRGFAGTRGGNLILGGGQGGTLGTNLSGDTRIELGDTDGSNDSARLGFYIGGGGERGWLQNATSGGVENLWLHSRKSWIISAFVDTKLAGSIADGVKLRNAADTVTLFQTNDTGCAWFGAAPVAQQTVTGSRATGAALLSLLTALGATRHNLIIDSSSA